MVWATDEVETTEVLFARKWHDGERELGMPPYEIVMTKTTTREGRPPEVFREVLTHPADVRIANAHAEAGGVEIAKGQV
jgi:hypothetical protein